MNTNTKFDLIDVKKCLVAIFMLCLPFGVPTVAQAQDVTIADWNFPGGRASAYTVRSIIEHVLGYQVEMTSASAAPVVWQTLDRGKGEIDIHTEVWLPNQGGLVDTFVNQKKSVELSERTWDAVQGYCVTPAAIEAGVTNVFDLSNPSKAALFDSNGDGKGEIWLGPEGWQSTNIERVRARDYGFSEFFELQSTDEAVATASLDKAFKNGDPWVGYCYGPHHNFNIFKLKLLDEPAHDPSKFVVVQPNDDPDWYSKSSVSSAYEDTNIRIGFSKNLRKEKPALVSLLENIQFNTQMINEMSYEIAINGKSPKDVADEWVSKNSDLVNSWLQ